VAGNKQLEASQSNKAPLSPEARAKLVAEARAKAEARDKARALFEAVEKAHKESEEGIRFYTKQEAKRRLLLGQAEEAFRLCEEAALLEEAAPQGALGALLSAYREACPKGKLV
jgi:hypothetical protein